jgi:hypothetical protein
VYLLLPVSILASYEQATFLAAVQAQLISFTYESNETPLQQGVNAVSFIGLAFDVIGTATGLISALTLSPSSARIHDAVMRAEESLAIWRELTEELTNINLEERTFSGRSIPREFFQEHMAKQRERVQRKSVLDARMKTWEVEEESRVKHLDDLRALMKAGKIKGWAPLMMMAIGIICFFLGLLGFVVDSQPRTVWVPTVCVVLVSVLALPLDAMNLQLERYNPRKIFGKWVIGMAKERAKRKSKAFQEEPDSTDASEKGESKSVGEGTTVVDPPVAGTTEAKRYVPALHAMYPG